MSNKMALDALTAIAEMDPQGIRGDDLGRAARTARAAIAALQAEPQPEPTLHEIAAEVLANRDESVLRDPAWPSRMASPEGESAYQERSKAIRAFLDSAILPLIGQVLEKKLTQAATFMRDELSAEPPPNEAGLRQLMGMNEADIDAELLAAGISPDDAVKRADSAIKGALATIRAERRAIEYGDIVHKQVVAMRAAVVAAKLESPEVGIQWIANTLFGPGHYPDIEAARELGGAQALFDKESAELEAFRAAHPAPALPATPPKD